MSGGTFDRSDLEQTIYPTKYVTQAAPVPVSIGDNDVTIEHSPAEESRRTATP